MQAIKVTISVKGIWEYLDRGKTNFRLIKVLQKGREHLFFFYFGKKVKNIENSIKIVPKSIVNNKKKTTEQYVKELEIKNPLVVVQEEYINNCTPIAHLHKKCGHVTQMTPTSALKGSGCVICLKKNYNKNIIKSNDVYKEELKQVNSFVVPLENYINDRTKIKHLCLKHNIVWEINPNNALHGKGCKECWKEKYLKARRKTQFQYEQELKEINSEVIPLEEYINANTQIIHLFKCGHKCNITPTAVLNGAKCPICNITKGELKISNYLNSKKIHYLTQYKYKNLIGVNGGLLTFDFYLFDYNLLIEFQGEQHEHPIKHFGGTKKFITQKIHDTRKRKYCHDHNINYLEIWYYEINKTEQILEQYLNNLKNNLKLETVTTTG